MDTVSRNAGRPQQTGPLRQCELARRDQKHTGLSHQKIASRKAQSARDGFSTLRLRKKPVRQMQQPRAGKERFAITAKSQLFENAMRPSILGMTPGEKLPRAERAERIVNDCAACLFCQAPTPKSRTKMKSQREDLFVEMIRTQSATTREFAALEEKDRPILKSVCLLASHFARHPLLHFGARIRAADEAHHIGIAAKRNRKGKVVRRPASKTQPY